MYNSPSPSEERGLLSEEYEDNHNHEITQPRRKSYYHRLIRVGLLTLGLLWGAVLLVYLLKDNYKELPVSSPTKGPRDLDLTVIRSGKLDVCRQSIGWVATQGTKDHGSYLIEDDEAGYRVLKWGDSEYSKTLVPSHFIEFENRNYSIEGVLTKPDLLHSIVRTSSVKNWRHSSTAHFWVLDTDSQVVSPVFSNHPDAMLSFAQWSPRGDRIAFVFENNLYIRHVTPDSHKVVQITFDGGKDIFYGRPDWVYEEEVFSGDEALWWSESGDYLAFLRTNDSSVPEFSIPYYVQDPDYKLAYPEIANIKYPKPGFSNPQVELLFLDLAKEEFFSVPEAPGHHDERLSLITEVLWTGNESVIIRRTNRQSDLLQIDLVNTQTRQHSIVRKEDLTPGSTENNDGGWFEITQDTAYVPADHKRGIHEDGYIDTVVADGFNHLAYFSPLNASVPKRILTSGVWEVDSAPAAYDRQTNRVYFIATAKSSVERHLYSVDLDGSNFVNVTDTSVDGYFGVSFSHGARFALLNYNGPEVPYQVMVDLHAKDPLGSGHLIEDNADLKQALQEYDLPSVHHSQVKLSEDLLVNAIEIRPPHFNPKREYPVLFYVYGGPGSQTVTKRFSYDFQKAAAAMADAVVVSVDGRGTGFMGRAFRACVHDQLGHLEALDQITAAKFWAAKSYVDASRMAIWGWSYGGYLTLKTLEADAGNTFQYGMAVAPVTDWRFYDSIYTERYMHTPADNFEGYERSRVHDMERLGNVTRFLVIHGTGDDNVHFQNTLSLLDDLDLASVDNFDVHVFPDSDHRITHHNANAMIYDRLMYWIQEAFDGRFDSRN